TKRAFRSPVLTTDSRSCCPSVGRRHGGRDFAVADGRVRLSSSEQTGDAPPPALGEEDSLEIVPECLVLPTDTNASRAVTVKAFRKDGRGAEGVRLWVDVGACESTNA